METMLSESSLRTLRFGVNYTPSLIWYHVWNDFHSESIASDLDVIAELGADHIRLMTLWPTFQPDPNWVSPAHLQRLQKVMHLAAQRNLDVCVVAFNGHLTGQNMRPGWQRERCFFTDAFMREKQELYLQELASAIGSEHNFLGFDLGNELNCCWTIEDRAQGDSWMLDLLSFCRELCPDGVHVNGVDHQPWMTEHVFTPKALATHQSIIPLHAWIYFTKALERGGPTDPPSLTLNATMARLARAYCGDPDKPIWIQEYGASAEWMAPELVPIFLEQSTEIAVQEGVSWFTWWSSHDVPRRFQVSSSEYSHGLITSDNNIKSQGYAFKRIAERWSGKPVRQGPRTIPPPPNTQNMNATWEWLENAMDFHVEPPAGVKLVARPETDALSGSVGVHENES